MKYSTALLSLFVFCLLISCSSQAQSPEIITMVESYHEAIAKEDADAAVEHMVDDKRKRGISRKLMTDKFNDYDFRYEDMEIEVISEEENKAEVKVRKKVYRVAGKMDFEDKEIVMIHHLRKIEGKWKVFQNAIGGEAKLE